MPSKDLEKNHEAQRRYRQRHAIKLAARRRQYYLTHREQERTHGRAFKARNRAKLAAKSLAYYYAHREQRLAAVKAYQLRRRQAR